MHSHFRRLAVLFGLASLTLSVSIRAQDEKPAANSDSTAEKSTRAPEQGPPPDSTTQGTIDAGGQHIAYTAIAGTITVGATDTDDAQLGSDGKPLPGSQLALAAPKEPAEDHGETAVRETVANGGQVSGFRDQNARG